MAVLKIYVIRTELNDRIKYALEPEKTAYTDFPNLNGLPDTLTDGINCFCDTAYEQMMRTKRYFGKDDKVQAYHFIQSFKPGEVTKEQAHGIGLQFAEKCFGADFEVVIGTHTDKAHLHNHIVVNSVSFEDGHKYRSTPKTFYELRSVSDEICREHGLSVIENPRSKSGKHYAEWRAENTNAPTIRSMIRKDIDVIAAQVKNMDELWDALRRRGYEIRQNDRRKYVAIRHPHAERFIRLKSLGDEYTPRQLATRIASGRGTAAKEVSKIVARRNSNNHRKQYTPKSKTVVPKGRKKLRGFRALYFRYLYMLGKVHTRKAPRRVRGMMLAELKKLEQYTKQYYFLRDHKLTTKSDVVLYADAIENEIDILTDRRARLYIDSRQPSADRTEIKVKTKQLTAEIGELRRQKRLCIGIQSTAPQMAEKQKQLQAELQMTPKEQGVKENEHRKFSSGASAPRGAANDRIRGQVSSERSGEFSSAAHSNITQSKTDRG